MTTDGTDSILEALEQDRQQFERRWATSSSAVLAVTFVVLMVASPTPLHSWEIALYLGAAITSVVAGVWSRRGGDVHPVLFGLTLVSAGVMGLIHVGIEPGDSAIFYALPTAFLGLFLLERRVALVLLAALAAVVTGASFARVHPDPYAWSHRIDALIILFTGSFLALLYRARSEREADQLEATVRELSLARAEAERATDSQRRFLASMSHELRTPLNAILGYTELVQESEGLDAADREDLDRVLGAGGHLLELIDDVLDIARIESGGRVVEPETIDLGALAAEAIDWTRTRGVFDAVLQVDEPVPLTSDRTMVRQILLNLLGNAARHAPGARVDVRIARGPREEAVLTVSDAGPGIPASDRDVVFEAFGRGQTARERTPGAGLGLALVARFCQLLGGTIELSDSDAGGARFDVTLPSIHQAICGPEVEQDGIARPSDV